MANDCAGDFMQNVLEHPTGELEAGIQRRTSPPVGCLDLFDEFNSDDGIIQHWGALRRVDHVVILVGVRK